MNNGYIAVIHYWESNPRFFGSFASPLAAFETLKREFELNVIVPERERNKERGFRPVISRKYKVQYSKEGIVALSIDVLEDISLFSKNK